MGIAANPPRTGYASHRGMRPSPCRWLVPLVVAFGFACGDDGGDDSGDSGDDVVIDAASGADSGGGDDGGDGATTPCPPTPDLECDSATEICVVKTPVGPAETSSCEPVPAGCEEERTCGCAGVELCTGSFDTCSPGEGENTIVCECPQCQ